MKKKQSRAEEIIVEPPPPKWEVTGRCFYCFEPLESLQPGGLAVRHIGGLPYKECAQAKKAEARG